MRQIDRLQDGFAHSPVHLLRTSSTQKRGSDLGDRKIWGNWRLDWYVSVAVGLGSVVQFLTALGISSHTFFAGCFSRCVHLRNLMYRHLTRMPHNLPHWSTPAAVDHRAKRWKDTNLCLNAIIITNSPQKLRLVITNLSGPLLSVCEGQHPIPKCGRTLKPVQLRLTGLCLEVRSRLRSTVKKIPRAVSIHEAIHWNAISQP